jgi:UDP-glucose 4-epimerase
MNKHVTITGACGFIGSSLSEVLHQRGYDLLLIDNLSHGYKTNLPSNLHDKLHIIDCFSQSNALKDLVPESSTIIHLAGISSLPECEVNPVYGYSNNVIAVTNILEIAVARKASKVIFASTSAVYENNFEYPFTEELPVTPDLVYSQTKYISEQICKSYSKNYNLSIICSRFFNVYGAKQDQNRKNPPFTAYLINSFENDINPTIFNWTDIKRDYIYYKDLNELILRMINANTFFEAEVFNCCSGYNYSTKEIFNLIADIYKKTLEPVIKEPEQIWDKYNLASRGFKYSRIKKEVYKQSIGCNKKVIDFFGYSPKYELLDGLNEIISGSSYD